MAATTARAVDRQLAAVTSSGQVVHRIDAEQYGRIVEMGLLEGQRVELIDGIIAEMSPQSEQHMTLVARLNRFLMTSELQVRPQGPLAVSVDSVPEPDLALTHEGSIHEHPDTAVLVIEISLTSDRVDRGRKQELYAAAAIPVYWIVDVAAQAVEVRTDPGPSGYRTLHTVARGETVPAPGWGVEPLPVDTLFRGF